MYWTRARFGWYQSLCYNISVFIKGNLDKLMKDYYRILSAADNTGHEEIRNIFRKLAGVGYDIMFGDFQYSQQDIFWDISSNKGMFDEMSQTLNQTGFRFD